MSHLADYEKLLPSVRAIPADQVESLVYLPLEPYINKAKTLYTRCLEHKAALVCIGFDIKFIQELEPARNALKDADKLYKLQCIEQENIERIWREKKEQAVRLKDDLLNNFIHAYRKRPDKLNSLHKIRSDIPGVDIEKHLLKLAKMGKTDPLPLENINFCFEFLDKAIIISKELRICKRRYYRDKEVTAEKKNLRNRFFTYLKNTMMKIDTVFRFLK